MYVSVAGKIAWTTNPITAETAASARSPSAAVNARIQPAKAATIPSRYGTCGSRSARFPPM